MSPPPFRLYIGINLFLCTAVTFMYRTCFTVALRDMVYPVSWSLVHATKEIDVSRKGQSQEVTRYNWSEVEQIYLICAYYIGYTITNLLGGILAERFGATKTISVILAVTAASFATIPKVASLGYGPLFALRVLQGSIEGPIYPAIQHIIAFWSPPSEKGRFIGIFAGSSFGSMIGHGIVSATTQTIGWPSSFYCAAVIGGLAWLYFLAMVTDRPDLHNRVTDKEKAYIDAAIGCSVNKDVKRIPYRTILQSPQVWALIVLNFGASFTCYFQMNSLPTYYKEVLGFAVHQMATILAVSSLVRLGTGLGFSYLGDFLLNKDYMGLTTQRKFFCLFSHIIPGVILLSMILLTKHAWFSAGLDMLNTAIMGAINLTVNQNSQDLSPNFASSIYGIVNFTGSISGFATLLFLALFKNVMNDSPLSVWNTMFGLAAALLFLSTGVFLYCGSGKIQPWNEPAAVSKSQEVKKPDQVMFAEMTKY